VIGKKKPRVSLAEGADFSESQQESTEAAASLSHLFQVCDPPKTESEPQFSQPSAPSFLKLAFWIYLQAPVPTGSKP